MLVGERRGRKLRKEGKGKEASDVIKHFARKRGEGIAIMAMLYYRVIPCKG